MGLACRVIVEYARAHYGFKEAAYLHEIGSDLNVFWELALRPLLFGSIGASFELKTIPSNIILKALAIILVGILARMLAAYAAVGGRGLTNKERQFIAVAWIPKATVQAALSTIPFSLVQERMATDESLVLYTRQIMATGILAILITAPLGLIAIQVLGPWLLSKQEPSDENQKESSIKQQDTIVSSGDQEKISEHIRPNLISA